ncbi:MAG: tRNA lysidine(34) synthetase TilS [Spirochaetia bacterium]|nr:tRNA lysidine(34) synthetase TilS [Spirochaetia bacterium]MCF7940808.1 tRNA lysidine(34) synthetase TilS [Spirochaetia bacterium]
MSIRERSVAQHVHDAITALLSDTASWLLAFSGGPDSVCLLDLLSSYDQDHHHRIGIAYVNHALRDPEELAAEERFVSSCAERYGCELHLLHAGDRVIDHLAQHRGNGVEEAARTIRYALLEQCRETHGYDRIITAHNQDDVFETLIMRFFKGSGVNGLCGIAQSSGTLVRPMLSMSKDEVYRYLEERQLSWSLDSTNAQQSYERNLIRQKLMPLIGELYPGYRRALGHLSEKMQITREHLSSGAESLLQKAAIVQGGYSIGTEVFFEMSRYERMMFLYAIWNELCPKGGTLPFSVIRELVERPVTAYEGTKTLFVYDRIVCYASKERLFWMRTVVPSGKNRYLKVVAGSVTELFSGYAVTCCAVERVERDALCLRADLIEGPLLVRSAIEGDQIAFRNGTKSIHRLFNDWKVPREHRWMIPVVAHSQAVLGVLGRSFGYADRIAVSHTASIQDKPGTVLWALKIVHVGDFS